MTRLLCREIHASIVTACPLPMYPVRLLPIYPVCTGVTVRGSRRTCGRHTRRKSTAPEGAALWLQMIAEQDSPHKPGSHSCWFHGRLTSTAGSTGALTPEVLAALPAELIGRMREATMNADLDQLLTLTDEVAHCDSRIAQRLRQFLDAFDYQSLLDVLPPGGKM